MKGLSLGLSLALLSFGGTVPLQSTLAQSTMSARPGINAAPSSRTPPGDAEIALGVANVVADLVQRLEDGFVGLRGAPVVNVGNCGSGKTQCWKSKVELPAIAPYSAVAHVAETVVTGPKGAQRFRIHAIELTRPDPIADASRKTFENAIALKLEGFQAERAGANAWCRAIDDRRTDWVEVRAEQQKVELSVVRMEFAEAQSGACFKRPHGAVKGPAQRERRAR